MKNLRNGITTCRLGTALRAFTLSIAIGWMPVFAQAEPENGAGREVGDDPPADRGVDELEGKVKMVAWKAYLDATDAAILAEEGPTIAGEFVLDREVEGLGDKEDRIHEVRFALIGGERTRGLMLVNGKTGQSLVVFPRKRPAPGQDAADHPAAPGPKLE